MTDPMYSNEFTMDSGFMSVKSEPIAMDSSMGGSAASASMPIPVRNRVNDMGDFSLDCEISNTSFQDLGVGPPSLYSSNSLWGTRLTENDEIKLELCSKMEDDDIFKVDKADLIQGPTLAELNANDETLLEDLNFDDLLLPNERSCLLNAVAVAAAAAASSRLSPTAQYASSSFPPDGGLTFYKDSFGGASSSVPSSPLDVANSSRGFQSTLSPASQHSSSPSTPPPSGVSPLQQRHSTLHELLLKSSVSPDRVGLGQSMPGPTSVLASSVSPLLAAKGGSRGFSPASAAASSSSRLSSSAPTHLSLDHIWQRREPRPHLLSTSSLAEAGSTSSLSTGGVLSPEAHDFSLDEGFDSEDDSDHYEDFSSDAESGSDGEGGMGGRGSKKERFFWQYNVQAKGPKGQRLVLKTRSEDPHFLNQVTDPVFSPECSVQGIKHSGKARKGDGNDLTPNPRKLHAIGKELDKLGKIINDMTPVNELPFTARTKTRKEKNKLASRACRLKKKAQHEANKIKLCGLECEHKRLLAGIQLMKQLYISKFNGELNGDPQEFGRHSEKITKAATKLKVAGQTTDFVNKILEKVKSGVANGGLDEI